MVLEESYDEDDAKSGLGPTHTMHNIQGLGSKYDDGLLISPQKNISFNGGDSYLLNNGNKDLDMSTKIAPESDRQMESKMRNRKSSKQEVNGSVVDSGLKKKKRKVTKKRLVMNVSQTKYYVVRYVAKKIYKMKLTHNDEEDWDICWQDGAV